MTLMRRQVSGPEDPKLLELCCAGDISMPAVSEENIARVTAIEAHLDTRLETALQAIDIAFWTDLNVHAQLGRCVRLLDHVHSTFATCCAQFSVLCVSRACVLTICAARDCG